MWTCVRSKSWLGKYIWVVLFSLNLSFLFARKAL